MGPPVRCEDPDQEAQQHPFLDYFLKYTNYAAPKSELEILRAKASYYGLMSEVDDNLGL
jgi:hypothetical protein